MPSSYSEPTLGSWAPGLPSTMSKVATTGWEITFFGWGYYRGLSVYACQALVAPKQAMRKGA